MAYVKFKVSMLKTTGEESLFTKMKLSYASNRECGVLLFIVNLFQSVGIKGVGMPLTEEFALRAYARMMNTLNVDCLEPLLAEHFTYES